MKKKLRNVAIIAHVDHGKTTLIEKLLQQSESLNKYNNITEQVLDFNDLEKERGITIFSKNASIYWGKYRINIVDTPGHADFGGEVERVMSMVDSVLLLVDAIDGPMPQTSFVTKKAFNHGFNPILVISKIDRPNIRPDWVINKVFDLFITLGATDEQLDFPIVYISALKGISGLDYKNMSNNMTPLFKTIIKNIKAPIFDINGSFQMQISQLDYNNYIGVIGIGRIKRGAIKPNDNVVIIDKLGKIRNEKVNKILIYMGLKLIETKLATSGDIIAVTGLGKLNISDTICNPSNIEAMPPLNIDEPTISMSFGVNTSPFCGKEGKYITSNNILERLQKELIYNVALSVEETKDPNVFQVSGRGELHLSILIENMRREGFEMTISRPQVIFRTISNEIKQEPFELVKLDFENKYQGSVIESMGIRKGKMCNMNTDNQGRTQLEYVIPSRGLIGFRTEFITITSGTGIIHSTFSHYDNAFSGELGNRKNGVLISNNQGKAVAYALYHLQERGRLFLGHGEEVYEGQIIGLHNRSNDITVNCLAGKKLTNMRASGTDEAVTLVPIIKMSLEQALEFIDNDELVEVTPASIRLRKRYLTERERKRANRI